MSTNKNLFNTMHVFCCLNTDDKDDHKSKICIIPLSPYMRKMGCRASIDSHNPTLKLTTDGTTSFRNVSASECWVCLYDRIMSKNKFAS